MTTGERYRRILANHLPPQAVEVVYDYLDRHRVHFHITRSRSSKLGDYRWPQGEHNYHEISVNGDLNPYLFFLVFLHEAAHLETHLKYTAPALSPYKGGVPRLLSSSPPTLGGVPRLLSSSPPTLGGVPRLLSSSPPTLGGVPRRGEGVQPHGHEWQAEYAALLDSHAALFPPEVQPLLKRYTRRIPLNRALLRQIEELLHRYDPDYSAEEHLTLDDLPAGSRFRLKSKPDICFESLERRRTRWLCRDLATGRQYTVAATAEVIVPAGDESC